MGFKTMKIKLVYFFLINLSYSIGLDGLSIPTTAVDFSTGNSKNIEVFQLNELFDDDSFLEYNSILWFPGISGHSIHWKNAKGII